MKFLLSIAMVALVVQFSHSKSAVTEIPSGHVFAVIIPYIAAVVDRIGIMLRNTLSQIPDTENYAIHRDTLRQLLQQTDEFKNYSPCMEKALPFSQEFKEFLIFYLKSNDATEYSKILKLLATSDNELVVMKKTDGLEKHNLVLKLLIQNGLMDMQADFESFILLVKSGESGSPVKLDSEGYKELFEKKC